MTQFLETSANTIGFTGIGSGKSLRFRNLDLPSDEKLRKGSFAFGNGEVYNGDWVVGERHGMGTSIFMGCSYDGQWDHNRRTGKAKVLYPTGEVYEGSFMDDMQCMYKKS